MVILKPYRLRTKMGIICNCPIINKLRPKISLHFNHYQTLQKSPLGEKDAIKTRKLTKGYLPKYTGDG